MRKPKLRINRTSDGYVVERLKLAWIPFLSYYKPVSFPVVKRKYPDMDSVVIYIKCTPIVFTEQDFAERAMNTFNQFGKHMGEHGLYVLAMDIIPHTYYGWHFSYLVPTGINKHRIFFTMEEVNEYYLSKNKYSDHKNNNFERC